MAVLAKYGFAVLSVVSQARFAKGEPRSSLVSMS